MTRNTWFALVLAAGAILASFTSASAKSIVSITIAGPGLQGTMDVTESEARDTLADIGGGGPGISPDRLPEPGDASYTVRLSFGDQAGKVLATNVYQYYPDPRGGRGYILFANVEGGESDSVGTWFLASAAWEASFRDVLSSHGVTLSPSPGDAVVPDNTPWVSAGFGPVAPWVLAAAATAAVSVLGFLGARGRRVSR